MKKIILAAVAAACMFSVSAASIGFRGDADFGMGKIEKFVGEDGAELSKPVTEKAETITSGTAAVWADLPFLNLGIVSLGFRPEAQIGIGEGFGVKGDDGKVQFTQTTLVVPLYLDACVNLAMIRVSAGVGPYVAMPLAFTKTGKTVAGKEIATPATGWDAHTWGIAGYVQAGLKLGPGYLLGDVRASAPFDPQELLTEDKKSTVFTSKTYKIGVGVGYEFKF